MLLFRSDSRLQRVYKLTVRGTGGFVRATSKNHMPNNRKTGLVISDTHPKTVKVMTESYHYF